MAAAAADARRVGAGIQTGIQTGIRRSAEPWRDHIICQLKHRDRNQHVMFQDLIRFYSRLLEKTSLTSGILNITTRHPLADSSSLTGLLHQNHLLKKTSGELAYQVVERQQQLKTKQCLVDEQNSRLMEERQRLEGALGVQQALQQRVEQLEEQNAALKVEYDELLERQKEVESRLREENLRGGTLLEDMIHLKKEAAARMNIHNERRSRARADLRKELTAEGSKVTEDSSSSAPTSRSTSPKPETLEEPSDGRRIRLFRSASVSSPRIFSSLKELFEKRRGHSVCSRHEDLVFPARICYSARVPARALHVLEAHDQGINAVRFSSSSALVATGGTDRLLKLWEVRTGSLTHRATLDGSTEGITCIDFDHTGSRVLASSYDKSALLWRLDDSIPKVTLTGHSRKVTAARFCGLHQVVTGGADRTVRLWDLHREACVRQVEVKSYCSDVVSSDNFIISGHFDSKIRMWDSRAAGCIQELPAQGKVTSLDLGVDQRLLLSCCRDDCLQIQDLRRWSLQRLCFRAEGFKCGSDSTKAVISPDGCYVAVGSADGAVYVWDVSSGNLETRLSDKHSSSISALSWSPSGEYVVSVDKSRRAVLWSDI
ncbi:ATG16 autophagy related 16-like 2 isoform X2 [Salarias fasciatus]|uniref:ATG16 autophagy related 16-like 2 isoform X2 n=1 Tax=Salarias fasciatus TaxID=181472 RepID=UPI001176AE2B|nr:autophagy-related protein 16-2-like isoform X2 [Salarias fasciatus]